MKFLFLIFPVNGLPVYTFIHSFCRGHDFFPFLWLLWKGYCFAPVSGMIDLSIHCLFSLISNDPSEFLGSYKESSMAIWHGFCKTVWSNLNILANIPVPCLCLGQFLAQLLYIFYIQCSSRTASDMGSWRLNQCLYHAFVVS